MRVSVISDTVQEFGGKRYYLRGRYFSRGEGGVTRYLHRVVWEHHNGPIPNGHHVHHSTHDRARNQIEDLELMAESDHLSHHSTNASPAQRAARRENQKRAMEWHSTDEGRAWHRQHGHDSWAGRDPKDYVCEQCGSHFQSMKPSNARFCTNACKSAWRRAAGVDKVTKDCAVCGAAFVSERHQKILYCSRQCSGKVSAAKRLGRDIPVLTP